MTLKDSTNSNRQKVSQRGSRGRDPQRLLRWGVLVAIVAAFGYLFIGGTYGWYNLWKLREQRDQLQVELQSVEEQKRDLTYDLELLQGDVDIDERARFELERVAREKHGMARNDELIYRFPAEGADSVDTQPYESDP